MLPENTKEVGGRHQRQRHADRQWVWRGSCQQLVSRATSISTFQFGEKSEELWEEYEVLPPSHLPFPAPMHSPPCLHPPPMPHNPSE